MDQCMSSMRKLLSTIVMGQSLQTPNNQGKFNIHMLAHSCAKATYIIEYIGEQKIQRNLTSLQEVVIIKEY